MTYHYKGPIREYHYGVRLMPLVRTSSLRRPSWRGWFWSFLIGGTMALVAVVVGL